jgi:hypothetical protein
VWEVLREEGVSLKGAGDWSCSYRRVKMRR